MDAQVIGAQKRASVAVGRQGVNVVCVCVFKHCPGRRRGQPWPPEHGCGQAEGRRRRLAACLFLPFHGGHCAGRKRGSVVDLPQLDRFVYTGTDTDTERRNEISWVMGRGRGLARCYVRVRMRTVGREQQHPVSDRLGKLYLVDFLFDRQRLQEVKAWFVALKLKVGLPDGLRRGGAGTSCCLEKHVNKSERESEKRTTDGKIGANTGNSRTAACPRSASSLPGAVPFLARP